MKFHPVGAELNADGRTDVTQLIDAFGNFANPSVTKGIVLATDKPHRLAVLRIPL